MAFRSIKNHLNGVLEIEADRYVDDRGYFQEVFKASEFEELGLGNSFVQDNHSRSTRGVIRGLHYQYDAPMGKLLTVLHGAIQLVELDVRKGSPTFGQHILIDLTDEHHKLVWIPPGFANGFCVMSDKADVLYKCTAEYNPEGEGGINPLDPVLEIPWGTTSPVVSDKDAGAESLMQYSVMPKF